jgi:hypothetical protein
VPRQDRAEMGDDQVILALDTADICLAATEDLGNMMKQGFLNLARARYSMGQTKVSAVF